MKTTRRNHYRTLFVQPEAPAEIISAAYRTLMTKLKAHPDLGGDPDAAVLLNQAYAVLNDPEKRARYDAILARRGQGPRFRQAAEVDAAAAAAAAMAAAAAGPGWGRTTGQAGRADSSSGAAGSQPGAEAGRPEADSAKAPAAGTGGASGAGAAGKPVSGASTLAGSGGRGPGCAWCGASIRDEIKQDARCHHCEAPIAPPIAVARGGSRDLIGRRRSHRITRNSLVAVFTSWGAPAESGRLQDISLHGLKVLVTRRIPEGRQIRVSDSSMDAVAEVVACVRDGRHWTVHARVTHVALTRRTGSFVSTTA